MHVIQPDVFEVAPSRQGFQQRSRRRSRSVDKNAHSALHASPRLIGRQRFRSPVSGHTLTIAKKVEKQTGLRLSVAWAGFVVSYKVGERQARSNSGKCFGRDGFGTLPTSWDCVDLWLMRERLEAER